MMSRGRPTKSKSVDAALQQMFATLERRPVPDRLRSTVEQLDTGPAGAPASKARKQG
jgi:hypothetical protein